MKNWICVQCGQEFAESPEPPPYCAICGDDRQYVRWDGQGWTDRHELARTHRLDWRNDLGVVGIGVEPGFAIGQRALLIQEADGCVLWDCTPLVTPEVAGRIKGLGGLKAVAISHPHYYGAMIEWSDAFGGIPIYLHADDRKWVMRESPSIMHWTGETHPLSPALTLIRCGGHFPGATMMHWSAGADGKGALFAGDIATVAMDRRRVSFMYSYPNDIPLNATAVRRVQAAVSPFCFDRIYGAWWGRNIAAGARAAFDASVDRYLRAIADPPPRRDDRPSSADRTEVAAVARARDLLP